LHSLRTFRVKALPEKKMMQRFDDALDALAWLFATKV
jgi:hypothetical protein